MTYLEDKTDALLQQGLVKAPTGFRDSVMQDIASYEREQSAVSVSYAEVSSPRMRWWQWLALTAGGVIGGGQVLRFIFSVWFVSSAAY